MRPLEGVFVLDFSTLLPGPMATLVLAEAGAEVVKIERPGRGEEMRGYKPPWWMNCVARLPEIEKKPYSREEYMTGS